MINSRILILATCSNYKDSPGNSNYDPETALRSFLPAKEANLLIERRRGAYGLLKSGERGGQLIDTHDYNRGLGNEGRDFGGQKPVRDYLPAILRYTGRFINQWGSHRNG